MINNYMGVVGVCVKVVFSAALFLRGFAFMLLLMPNLSGQEWHRNATLYMFAVGLATCSEHLVVPLLAGLLKLSACSTCSQQR